MHSCQSLLPDCQIRQNGQKDLRSAKILFSQMQKIASLNFCTPANRFCRIAKSGRMVRKTSGVRKFYFRKCRKPLHSISENTLRFQNIPRAFKGGITQSFRLAECFLPVS